MSKLMQMRQRIKAVETIKKITHAMRLISMSSHSRLRNKKALLEEYKNELSMLLKRIGQVTEKKNNLFPSSSKKVDTQLIILVGSQKGLCGVFNNNLFSFFEKKIEKLPNKNLSFITIGKKAVDYLSDDYGTISMQFSDFTLKTLPTITQAITSHILDQEKQYRRVLMCSNWPKTFFLQKPQIATILPHAEETDDQTTNEKNIEEYAWEQPKEELIQYLAKQRVYLEIYTLLLQSLIAEQAARFVAMDSSTRNATTVLDEMLLTYNKTRQANITRELTDLAGSF